MYYYSWSRFGREAEYVVALHLKTAGWDVRLSPGSRGPADITATRNDHKWFIQVKASLGIPRLKGSEVRRLKDLAERNGGLPVVSMFQPFPAGFSKSKYSILFYELDSWRLIDPVGFLERGDCGALQSEVRSRE
ncbi:MAG TPA: hypothetical protein VF172_06205 [Nitrososphaera sp.]